MRVFVTGSTGFIGSNLIQKLSMNGYQVLALARDIKKVGAFLPKNNVKIIEESILDQSVIRQAIKESNAIVHLAAVTSEKETDYRGSYEVNVTGSKNLIDLCMKHEVKKFITLSSESTKRKIQVNYAKTKSIVDDLVRKYLLVNKSKLVCSKCGAHSCEIEYMPRIENTAARVPDSQKRYIDEGIVGRRETRGNRWLDLKK